MTAFNPLAADLVRKGFAAQNAGDTAAAEAAYRQALQHQPDQADALQLLGLLERRRGNLGAAEDLMRRSLRARPAQAHVWNNLGNLLERAGRSAEAEASFDEALRLQPIYADAHYNRARVLLAMGRILPAQAAAERALALSPRATAALLQLKAQIQAEMGELALALGTLDQALALAPDKPALMHDRATLLQRCHRYREALQAHDRALSLGLDAADAHYNRGNTLQSLGRNDMALAAYRAALARDSGHRLALFDLSRLRWRMGEPDFAADLRRASDLQPTSPIGPGLQARLLWRAERFDEAAAAFREALRRAPEAAEYHDGLGRCLVRLGDIEAGLASQAHAIQRAPADASLLASHAASLLVARRPTEAAAQAQAACRLAPQDQYGWAVLGLAWRLLGDARESWLNDYERLVSVVDLEAPDGFSDMAAFTSALVAELHLLHVDREAPVDQTLRIGTQTFGDIFEQGHPLVDALKARIAQAVQRYIDALPRDPDHPTLKWHPQAWRFTDSWSSRLRRGGFHTHHVHPHGWISSACYVAVPPAADDSARQQGWLQFGAPDFDIGLETPVRLRVQPKPGRLALFPSLLWHGTTPFDDAAERLTIAFDVKPA